jgi:glycosyltransferase involved in cell wall biosynthesis
VKADKGHETLLRAAAELIRDDRRFTLHIYGSGDPKFIARLHELCVEAQLTERVTFHGFVADKAAIYQSLDVVVVPSVRDEPFGLAALEPAAHGLPVVASDRGGLPEVVLPEKTGLLFPAGDSHALSAQLARLIDDPSLRRALGVAGYRRLSAEFTEENMQRRLETIHDQWSESF